MDLVQCSKHLIYKDPFYGHVALGLQKEFSTKIKTACAQVVGMNINLYFNEEFFNKLTDKQKIGLMQHELGHVCLFHLAHWDLFAEKEIYNIATDMCINQYIEAEYLPPSAILPNSFPELKLPTFKDSQTYYDLLMQANKNGTSPNLTGLVNYMKSGGQTVSSHELWDEWNDGDGEGEEGNEGKGSGKNVPSGVRDLIKKQIEHQIKEVYENNLGKNPGNIPGYLRDLVLGMYKNIPPVLDWKGVIRQFKSFCDKQKIKFTRNKPNKRYPDSDAITLQQQRRMLVGVDTSGSISNEMLQQFFAQIHHMSKTGVEIDVCEWDSGIQRIYSFSDKKKWQSGEVKGGGGTNPYEVVEYLNKSRNHNAMIMFTDGFIAGSWKNRSKPILWVITSGGNGNLPDWPGKKIVINK